LFGDAPCNFKIICYVLKDSLGDRGLNSHEKEFYNGTYLSDAELADGIERLETVR